MLFRFQITIIVFFYVDSGKIVTLLLFIILIFDDFGVQAQLIMVCLILKYFRIKLHLNMIMTRNGSIFHKII